MLTEDKSLRRYGLRPGGRDIDEIRELLPEHTALERASQGDGDTELMELCCVQLFNAGRPAADQGLVDRDSAGNWWLTDAGRSELVPA